MQAGQVEGHPAVSRPHRSLEPEANPWHESFLLPKSRGWREERSSLSLSPSKAGPCKPGSLPPHPAFLLCSEPVCAGAQARRDGAENPSHTTAASVGLD